ncbi:putative leucine-rich repeat protein 1 (LRRP1) [Trypanosoma conorhini]|uniref:Putative leucine-rich repeat protein 1 (LRRP1) n=1 Tax=Trypanosoma conorhini TaxID=83891 RepID=A0A3R7KM18_9TRYP|nr:putative leucine-rich repeat protein 1 (LRRP1) [Trypanosoma conorhini]RNF04279.1 putative leucine-rich repeat protein 1 (LRRP1) [Trypanosoma conorhini]
MLPKITAHRKHPFSTGSPKRDIDLPGPKHMNNVLFTKSDFYRRDRRELARVPTLGESEICSRGNESVMSSQFLPILRLLKASTTAISDEDLKEIANNRSLQKIFLQDCKNLTDVGAFSSTLTLEEMHLRGCSKLVSIGDIGQLPLLWLLDLSKTSVTDNDLKSLSGSKSLLKIFLEDCKNLTAIDFLSSITSIEEISIRGCHKVKHIGSLGLLSALHTLDVSKISINNSGLLGLGASRSLEKIFLENCKQLSNVSTFSSIRSLREIYLSRCVRLTSVDTLGTLPALCVLDASKTSLTDEGLEGLSASRSLEKIILEDCVCLACVSALSYIISLKEIYLSGCTLISEIGVLGLLPALCVLDASKTSLTDEGLEGLSASRSLEKIILEDCVCLTCVSELSSVMSLKELRLRGCNRLTIVSGLGLLPDLCALDLSMTAVTGVSLRGLGESPSLSKLFLENCLNLTSVQSLSTVLALEEIYLRGCVRVSDVGALGALPVLQLLDVSKTSVTDEGLDGLSASLTLKRILLEDCAKLTTVASLTYVHTIEEMNVCGCSGVTSFI